jgi:hypothetical protein
MLELPAGVPEPVSRPGIKWAGLWGLRNPNDPRSNERIEAGLPTYALSEDEARYHMIREWWSQQPQDAKWRQMNTDLNAYYYGNGSGIYYKRRAKFDDAHMGDRYNLVYDANVANLIG